MVSRDKGIPGNRGEITAGFMHIRACLRSAGGFSSIEIPDNSQPRILKGPGLFYASCIYTGRQTW